MVRNPPADWAPAAVQPARRSMLPLLAVAGALLVFIWTFADFATPLVLGVQDLLAPQVGVLLAAIGRG